MNKILRMMCDILKKISKSCANTAKINIFVTITFKKNIQ